MCACVCVGVVLPSNYDDSEHSLLHLLSLPYSYLMYSTHCHFCLFTAIYHEIYISAHIQYFYTCNKTGEINSAAGIARYNLTRDHDISMVVPRSLANLAG